MFSDLNEAQRQAVTTRRGPLLVLAGAGTGKTRVVTVRIAELIRHGSVANRILAVTFTNKAAKEMQQRIRTSIGRRAKDDKPAVGTFHAHCVQILRRHIRRLGYPENFAIYDGGDQESVARAVLREIKVPTDSLRPGELIGMISAWKSRSLTPRQAASLAETDKQHLAAVAYRRYQQAVRLAGAVDFDDLLLCTLELFQTFDDVRREEANRFDHLLIDEYQDTNTAQYRIVKALAQNHRNLCVVGDDDQSIYGFRGADVEHILRFAKDWPDAVIVRLEENYRCTGEILAFANQLIGFNPQRHGKILRPSRPSGQRPRIEQFPNEDAEAKGVVGDMRRWLQRPGMSPRDFAILFRTNEQTRPFEAELRKANIPYVLIGGMSFFDRREVRDVMAYLKLLVAPQDEVSLLRVLNTPPRGIGEKTIEQLMRSAVKKSCNVWNVMQDPTELEGLPPAARGALAKFAEQIRQVQRAYCQVSPGRQHQLASDWLRQVKYATELDRQYPDEQERQSRWGNVEQVINALAQFEKEQPTSSLLDFLQELALNSRDFDSDKDKELKRDAVMLLTYHSAKGLEFPHVYMVGMEEGILPHHRSMKEGDRAIEEERRLCYVGITRAQEMLTLTLPLTRMKWGKARESQPSRFLYEMTGMAERGANSSRSRRTAHGRP
jgi:DNA helicase II / ATP-dependent DNA helicase PcrA